MFTLYGQLKTAGSIDCKLISHVSGKTSEKPKVLLIVAVLCEENVDCVIVAWGFQVSKHGHQKGSMDGIFMEDRTG